MIRHTLYRRDATWWVSFHLDGIHYRKTTKCPKRTDAEQMANLIIRRTVQQVYGESKYTLAELMTRYIKHIGAINGPITVQIKVTQLGRFSRTIGNKRLNEITPAACQEFLDTLKLSKATVNRHLTTLRHMFNVAIDWELCRTNPCRRIKLFRELPRLRFFSDDEVRTLLKAAKAKAMGMNGKHAGARMIYLFLKVALLTGMRKGEILDAKWTDIQGSFLAVTKKGKRRLVPLQSGLKHDLMQLDPSREAARIFHGLQADNLQTAWERICKETGIHDARIHDLRHTAATRYAAVTDLSLLREIFGWSSLAMVQRYAHATAAGKSMAAEGMALPEE